MEDPSRRRRLILITLGVVLAVVAGAVAFMLSQGTGPRPDDAELGDVLVAARDIAPRTTLTADDVVVRQVPADTILPQAYREASAAIGLVNSVAIYPGQQITPNLFATTDPNQVFSILEPDEEVTATSPFWRGVSVAVPKPRAVGGQLLAGQRVDLFVTLEFCGAEPLDPPQTVLGVPFTRPDYGPTSSCVDWHLVPSAIVDDTDPENLDIRSLTGARSTKITFPDVKILHANIEEGLYILRVDLHQAEQIAHINQLAPDAFAIALRPEQDTRAIDPTEYGETNTTLVMQYLYRVPELLDLFDWLELMGIELPVDLPPLVPPLDGEEAPPEEPEPEPEPSPSPAP